MLKHIRNLAIVAVVLIAIVAWFATRPDTAQVPIADVTGDKPKISDARPQRIPTVNIASVERWTAAQKPTPAAGLSVARFADGLDHPRNLYALPNGDILVAETNAPPKQGSGGIGGWLTSWAMNKAGAGVPSANRITLLRDADGDGRAELKTPFITGLNSPFGMVLVGSTLYVANTDAVVAFPYVEGETRIAAKPKLVYKLRANAPNMHWTRNLVASPDGAKLYISVGSNSNIAEGGMAAEKGRAMVIEYDIARGTALPYATGMRNPVGLAWNKASGELWATVNERDMLGSDLVPDYLGKVEFGADYGWPMHYWGGYTDDRVKPQDPSKRQYERRPDYALGPHVAALGLAFADGSSLGSRYAGGAFVALHGSWNRVPAAGYDVVHVTFAGDKPVGKPQAILSGFLVGDKARGRPTMLALDKSGALLVSDDVGNVIWRVTGTAAGAAGAKTAR